MTTHDPIPTRPAALKTTPMPDLKQQWRDLFNSEPPPFNRRYLESRLAYRIQELAYGGLKPETIRRLELAAFLDGETAAIVADRAWPEHHAALLPELEAGTLRAALPRRVGSTPRDAVRYRLRAR